MSFIDRFLNAIKLNDDYDDDDDFLDDEDASDFDDDDDSDRQGRKKRFFSRFVPDDDDDLDDFDDYEEPPKKQTARSASSSSRSASSQTRKSAEKKRSAQSTPARNVSYASRSSGREERSASTADTRKKQPKVTPIRKKSSLSNMEVNVIRPSSMEDTRDIADTLIENCTVVLNLEGLDVDIAQRVIDFTCGVCYSLNGNLQKVSSYIFILTPENVELSGDFQSILSGAFDIAPMRSGF